MRLPALILALPAFAAVTTVHVTERSDVLGGRSLGPAGAYERVQARACFAVDPKNAANAAIRDLELAPKNDKGLVEFCTMIDVLKPRDPKLANGTLLLEVPNRGGKGMLSRFQYGQGGVNPQSEEDFGDLSLMQQGFTLAWVGWQWDVPRREGLLRAEFPVLEGVKGVVRAEFIPGQKTTTMPLSDRSHLPYPVADRASLKVTVRAGAFDARTVVAPGSYRLVKDNTEIEMAAGFLPGQIYEAVYTAANPPVVGLGLVAIRDFTSYLRHQGNGTQQLGEQPSVIKRSLAFGISQSGRYLRTFLFYGMNADEKGRKVFDGIWADVAGAGRGSFNHRFAQASRDGHPFLNLFYPTDLPPFANIWQATPEAAMPKVFLTNGSYEYWGRNAALLHTTEDGTKDLELPPFVRMYTYAGATHGPAGMPQQRKSARYPTNPNDFRPIQRALLAALHAWVKDGTAPPDSVLPRIDDKTLTGFGALAFPKLAGVAAPRRPKAAMPLLFGPGFNEQGIVTLEPPRAGTPYPTLVPQTAADGNEKAGIKMPYVAAPLGAFAGWNMKTALTGAPEEIEEMVGSFFAFPRAVIEKQYASKDAYLAKTGEAADALIQARFLLPQDKERAQARAAAIWDYVMAPPR
jgi:hypothetical protein